MKWEKTPLTRQLARELRAATRASRPEIDGHSFSYNNLAEMWASDDGAHVVLTHDGEQRWQYWQCMGHWRLVSLHQTRAGAQQAAQEYVEPLPTPEVGTYVLAREGKRTDEYVIRVHCSSEDGPRVIAEAFARLGYATRIEKVT